MDGLLLVFFIFYPKKLTFIFFYILLNLNYVYETLYIVHGGCLLKMETYDEYLLFFNAFSLRKKMIYGECIWTYKLDGYLWMKMISFDNFYTFLFFDTPSKVIVLIYPFLNFEVKTKIVVALKNFFFNAMKIFLYFLFSLNHNIFQYLYNP